MRSPWGGEGRRGALLALLAAALLAGCSPEAQPPAGAPPPVECLLDEGPCLTRLGDLEVTLEVLPRPVRTMTDLAFRVEAVAGGVPLGDREVGIDLTMPGMVMAENRIILSPAGEGTYEGTGVIVRCPRGGKRWRATVLSPSIPHLAFDFTVDGKE